jgi:hypothetical protein
MNEWRTPFRRSIERMGIADSLAGWSVRPNGMEFA